MTNDFYVVAYEPGAEHPSLPTWASYKENPAQLAQNSQTTIKRIEVTGVPATLQLLNVLSHSECQRFIALTEALNYLPDAPVSLPRSVRHNDNVTWVVDKTTTAIIWQRVAEAINNLSLNDSSLDGQPLDGSPLNGKPALAINARFRFYRYGVGDFFKPHTDGAWHSSQVIDNQLIVNAQPDQYSQMSFLIFLSDDFEGGETRFFVDGKMVDVRTPLGGVLAFPHGQHLLHCVHSSEPITSGTKYIIRSDLMFAID